jgi:hypothetical protein
MLTEADLKLTEEQKKWFGDRMSENDKGAVIVSPYAYKKFRVIAENEHMSNDNIKGYLIDYCYE